MHRPDAPFPPICGTAMLTIQRMRRLAATIDAARLDVESSPSGLVVHLDVPASVADGLTLPAHLGVSVASDKASFDPAHEARIELRAGEPVRCSFPPRSPGSTVFVHFRDADALHMREATVRTA